MFVAADGHECTSHRVRKTSTKEYYDLCGYNVAKEKRRQFKLAEKSNVLEVIDAMPTLKTANFENICAAIVYRLNNFIDVSKFYDQDFRYNVLKLKSYQGRQKALAEIGRRLTCGSRKYGIPPTPYHNHMLEPDETKRNKWRPLSSCDKQEDAGRYHHHIIAFGNASIGNMRGKLPAPTKLLLRHLQSLDKAVKTQRLRL
jgi:hypothetical protein